MHTDTTIAPATPDAALQWARELDFLRHRFAMDLTCMWDADAEEAWVCSGRGMVQAIACWAEWDTFVAGVIAGCEASHAVLGEPAGVRRTDQWRLPDGA